MRSPVGALCVVSRGIIRLGVSSETRIFHEDSVFQGKHYVSKSVALCVPPLQHYASFRWSIMRRLVGALCVAFPWHLRMDLLSHSLRNQGWGEVKERRGWQSEMGEGGQW